jgi:hypothetical protein
MNLMTYLHYHAPHPLPNYMNIQIQKYKRYSYKSSEFDDARGGGAGGFCRSVLWHSVCG